MREIETHTGLFIESGYQQYEFSHKSIQEYLTAEHLVKLPSIPDSTQVLERIPNELAIAIAISSSPSSYLIELIYNRFSKRFYSYNFLQTFINRLLLEKPDFNYNKSLGVAFLDLYSSYTKYGIGNKVQLELFLIENLNSEFEKFLQLIIPRTSFDKLITNYDFKDAVLSDTGDKIYVLALKKGKMVKSDRFRSNKENSLPALLYCREDFLNIETYTLPTPE